MNYMDIISLQSLVLYVNHNVKLSTARAVRLLKIIKERGLHVEIFELINEVISTSDVCFFLVPNMCLFFPLPIR